MPDRKETNLHRWIHEQNVIRYRSMLASEHDQGRRELIKKMLHQELKALRRIDGEKRDAKRAQTGLTGYTFTQPQ